MARCTRELHQTLSLSLSLSFSLSRGRARCVSIPTYIIHALRLASLRPSPLQATHSSPPLPPPRTPRDSIEQQPKNRDVLQSRQPALQLLDLGVQEEELVELEGLHDGAGGVARLWPTTPLVELEGLHAFLEGLHAFGSPAEWSAFVEQVAGKKARASSVLDFPFADNQLKRG